MILNIFAFKNKKVGVYTRPQFDDHEVDTFLVTLKRALLTGDDNFRSQFKNLELHVLGTFDDEASVFANNDNVDEVLLDCDELLKKLDDPALPSNLNKEVA